MNTADIVILLFFVPGIIRGLSKGLVEQAVSLVGVVLGIALAYRYYVPAGAFIGGYVTLSETLQHILGFAAVLVVVLLVVLLVAKLLTKLTEMATLGWLNKALGLVFALLATALVLSLLILFWDTVCLKFQLGPFSTLEESVLYGYLKDFGYVVFPYLKQWLGLGASTVSEMATTAVF